MRKAIITPTIGVLVFMLTATVFVCNACAGRVSSATNEKERVLAGHTVDIKCVAFSADGHTLASGSYDATVRLWNTATWRELMRLDPGGTFVPRSLTFSPDGSQLLAASFPTILWSTRTGDERTRLSPAGTDSARHRIRLGDAGAC